MGSGGVYSNPKQQDKSWTPVIGWKGAERQWRSSNLTQTISDPAIWHQQVLCDEEEIKCVASVAGERHRSQDVCESSLECEEQPWTECSLFNFDRASEFLYAIFRRRRWMERSQGGGNSLLIHLYDWLSLQSALVPNNRVKSWTQIHPDWAGSTSIY